MKPTTTIRIDTEDKDKANIVFKDLGISFSTAINAFLKAVIREGRIPFDMNSKASKSSKNMMLNKAYVNKKDEFYTMYEDIEKEIFLHKNQFFGKAVLCNCDDPFESEFFKFFVINFNFLHLTQLTTTCYANTSRANTCSKAYKAIITEVQNDCIQGGILDINALFESPKNKYEELKGDGDFRSQECMELLQYSDIIVTNPPFSLFREYITTLIKSEKLFLIIGNMNAVTYKEVFPLFMNNKVWYGESIKSGDRKFNVPDDYPLSASNCGIDSNGRRFIRVKGIRWFTNMDTNKRHDAIPLLQKYSSDLYPHYENYDAIDVSKTKDIPSDYYGLMGVPITFLDKYCPDQFQILLLANGNTRTNAPSEILEKVGYVQHPEDRGGVCIINGQRSYARVIIQRVSKNEA